MLKPESREIATQFWASELGAETFAPGAIVVQEHIQSRIGDLGNRIFCLTTNTGVFVTSPRETVEEIEKALGQTTESPFSVLMKLFDGRGRVVGGGPAFIGYRDESILQTVIVCQVKADDHRVEALFSGAHQLFLINKIRFVMM